MIKTFILQWLGIYGIMVELDTAKKEVAYAKARLEEVTRIAAELGDVVASIARDAPKAGAVKDSLLKLAKRYDKGL